MTGERDAGPPDDGDRTPTAGDGANAPSAGDDDHAPKAGDGTRRATVRTTHDEPGVVAAALSPDNTDEMRTRLEGGAVVTTVVRGSTGGLRSTVDDYAVNCSVAERTVQHARRHTPQP